MSTPPSTLPRPLTTAPSALPLPTAAEFVLVVALIPAAGVFAATVVVLDVAAEAAGAPVSPLTMPPTAWVTPPRDVAEGRRRARCRLVRSSGPR
ncbi:MAG: hypothetical protein WDN30_16115 [Pararobbsia sp.]